MASFSERMGKRKPRVLVQTDDLDSDTRLALWNTFDKIHDHFDDRNAMGWDSTLPFDVLQALWTDDFKLPRDEFPDYTGAVWPLVKERMLGGEWFAALECIENFARYVDQYANRWTLTLAADTRRDFNDEFERFLVGYRFVGTYIVPIAMTAEADAVSAGIEDASPIPGARHALERATDLFADRENPDYPNSIKESISAVEAAVKRITGKGELSKGITALESRGLQMHSALKSAWIKMYGWTSAEDGIRHGGIDAADADQALARYALTTCSAFVSYLMAKAAELRLFEVEE